MASETNCVRKRGRTVKQVLSAMFMAVAVVVLIPLSALAISISVPGTSDPWLAGMPNGSTASLGDTAPDQSPVLVLGLNLGSGVFLTFNVSGAVSNGPCCALVGPDGGGFISHTTGAENGIADATAPINALVGVFLDNNQPDLTPPPSSLDFGSIGLGFPSLSPGLKQVFFIGDGLTGTGSGATQEFFIPAGATRLFLGTMDGFEWSNNLGSFDVTVPEPSALLLFPFGLTVMGLIRRRLIQGIGE